MKIIFSLMILSAALWCMADPPPVISFNLVQVNHYYNQPVDTNKPAAAGQRIVVDVGAQPMLNQFRAQAQNHTMNLSPVTVDVQSMVSEKTGGFQLPWGSCTVLKSTTGTDSFLVTSSRTGCPGTEVRPSVSVAFRNSGGWSDPPIRFGPLAERTFCPLGKGYGLDVSVVGNSAPLVRLRDMRDQISSRH